MKKSYYFIALSVFLLSCQKETIELTGISSLNNPYHSLLDKEDDLTTDSYGDNGSNKMAIIHKPENLTTSTYWCDSIRLGKHILPPFTEAKKKLDIKLSYCTNAVDSLETITSFVFRIFNFGGTGEPIENWENLPFIQMYEYGRLDKEGVYCGERTKALEYLLYEYYGYRDFIEISYQGYHDFLLVKLSNGKTWIADAYSPHGFANDTEKMDYLSFLILAKNNSEKIKIYDIPRRFGHTNILFDQESINTYLGCQTLLHFVDVDTLNILEPDWRSDNMKDWLDLFLYETHPLSAYPQKFREYTRFVNEPFYIPGTEYNIVKIWACPDVPLSCTIPVMTSTSWGTSTSKKIKDIIGTYDFTICYGD